jgi:hypothetical protein
MNYDKYIGKGWSYSLKSGTEIYYIIDIKEVDVKRSVKDENGRTIFDQIPHKKGDGFKTVMRTEVVKKPALLAIKVKYTTTSLRYSITNPTAQYAVNDSFFDKLKRDKSGDKLIYGCLKYLFEISMDRWKIRYSGYKNLLRG